MATYPLRVNLTAAEFPLLSSWSGRTIIIPQLDQTNPKSSLFTGDKENTDMGIPQPMFLQNVMPVTLGFASVDYQERVPVNASGHENFSQAFLLRGVEDSLSVLGAAGTEFMVFDPANNTWASRLDTYRELSSNKLTYSEIAQRTFVCIPRSGVYEYDPVAKVFNRRTLVGLDEAEIIGITAVGNYNIAYSKTTLYWSSLVDELDFVESLSTGAGSSEITTAAGAIVAVLPILNGLVVYTTVNASIGLLTNNDRIPFNFRPVSNAAGITFPEHVAYDGKLKNHYAWTTAGLQQISASGADNVFPEVTEFLSLGILETWNAATHSITAVETGSPFFVKLNMLENRYLIISYGTDSQVFSHALVYDTAAKRWGKLALRHVDTLSYQAPTVFGGEITYEMLSRVTYNMLAYTSYAELEDSISFVPAPRNGVGFLQPDGRILTLLFNPPDTTVNADTVLMLGKFQLTRSSTVTHETSEIELGTESPLTFHVLGSLLGKSVDDVVVPTLITTADKYRRYGAHYTAMNLRFCFTGVFDLRTIITELQKHGDH